MESQYFKRLLCIMLGTILIIFVSLASASPAQADDFKCFERGANPELCKGRKPILANSCSDPDAKFRCCEGKYEDYDISSDKDRKSDVTVLAIHGGLIEPGTSEISQELADRYNWNYYIFSGHGREQCLKGRDEDSPEKRNFGRLHITSTRFNHQKALDLVSSHPKSVAIHGYNPERRKYPKGVICVGGRNENQVKAFINHVKANSSTFTDAGGYKLQPINAAEPKDDDLCVKPDPPLTGIDDCNIVNRNCKGKGLQLELSDVMRADLANKDESRFNALRNIIYGAIKEAMDIGSSNCSEAMGVELRDCP